MVSQKELGQYKNELEEELSRILDFWQQNTVDKEFGGFHGKIDYENTVFAEAPKGSVLNSRILWAFSAACNLTGNTGYLHTAERAFHYILDHFVDHVHGGVYWSVDYKGDLNETKKQVYAQSFAIYGLSEFYQCSKNEEAMQLAIKLYNLIVDHSYDTINGGYIEALSREWKEINDLRLSKKDANEKKSMNTHLHVMEGFAALYLIWPDKGLQEKISGLVHIFLNHIIDQQSGHLDLFFDEQWNVKSDIVSYGHDIEAAWLVQESAEAIGDAMLVAAAKEQSIKLAAAAAEGLDTDGGLWYEYDRSEGVLVTEKHSWPQAEAMIGFYNAWELTGDESYFRKSVKSWQFVKGHILDTSLGEWLWGVTEDYSPMNEDKVGIWKCPYHNSRACIELIRRITGRVEN